MNIAHLGQQEFIQRHIGPNETEIKEMLNTIGEASVESLISKTIPASIRLAAPLQTGSGMSEHQYLRSLKTIASLNKVYKSYIGKGYYNTITPSVILRNILENPGWYTQYTPYQAEIAQGRLESLLNYQTMVSDLTGLPIANASLLDEGTAAAAAIRQAILDRAAAGAAVVVISQDLDELLQIADSFAVLNEGRLTSPRPVKGLTVDQIGLMMGGAHGMEVVHHAEA
jgi:glycine cleavage system pyridoxal-binding protein P